MTENMQCINEESMEKHFFRASADDFKKIIGNPVEYLEQKETRLAFTFNSSISDVADADKGMAVLCEMDSANLALLDTVSSFNAFYDRYLDVANSLLRSKSTLPGLT